MGRPSLSNRMRESCMGLERLELLAAGELANTRLERLNLTDELIGLCGEASRVDVHARALHGGEDAYERHLDLGEEGLRPWASSAEASGSRRVRASQAPRAAMLTASAGAPSSPAADGRDACK